jgi:hypothetical protein
VDDRPLSAFSHPDSNRLHHASAIRFAVSWLYVQMNAMQTVRAMVAMLGSAIGAYDEYAATAAYEMTLMMLFSLAVAYSSATFSVLQR